MEINLILFKNSTYTYNILIMLINIII